MIEPNSLDDLPMMKHHTTPGETLDRLDDYLDLDPEGDDV